MANIIKLGQITEYDIFAWIAKYEKREDGYYCKQCGSRILRTPCYVSVRLDISGQENTDFSRECKIKYPYCPICDGEIDYATARFYIGQEVYDMIINDPGEKSVSIYGNLPNKAV